MKRPLKIALSILLFIVLSLGSGFYYTLRSLNAPLEAGSDPNTSNTDELVEGGRQNILLLGMDAGTLGAKEEHNRHRSDTILVVSLDKKNKDVKILSIPRDTRIRLGEYGIQKINAATAFGGADLAVKTVKNFLGVPIHNYVVVKLSSFKNIVEALGGVDIDIKERMKYSDPAGGIYIDLYPGQQTLDGDKAEQFVRYRGYADADIGRVKAQQQFVEALIKKALKPATLLKLPKIIDIIQENVETDIQPLEMASLANFARQVKQEDIKMYIVPGEGKYISGTSYFIPFQNQLDEMIDEIFFDDGNIKVAVLNGNGAKGVASKVASKLESQGFKVVTVANADNFDYETTTIIYPKDKKSEAEEIAKVLTQARLEEEADDSIVLPTIIVGKDAN
ncbi:Cell envelope-related transcriptional attenuator [Tepidanaerobacter acetatoxydans Re1]|uniref:Cell envelope-related transcriptional attenuator n=1 Tax=Tepidanaerobacter acetatoxydans (strain DSM 21804 / JCM 16047 / Re1) TaxID=1209989 RepID=F4LVY8_TEPAE|nr:LCP family protein [Tepidanaerobacter acetatoxydans]AEE91656.1 cell envelope-related transcriptional attenuator [Tepidanaerobacter acetatoxydans Re1]CDI40763.1 Cell envelope-related transcriptional attenuator [Tepidanaerobacter acetatoxydans Re1]